MSVQDDPEEVNLLGSISVLSRLQLAVAVV